MSHTFSIRSDKPISLGTTLDKLPISGIKITESDEVDNSTEPWPAGYLHLYIDGVTCRSIELLREGDRYDVRIMAASSVEDTLLAIALSSTLAKELGAPILPKTEKNSPWNPLRKPTIVHGPRPLPATHWTWSSVSANPTRARSHSRGSTHPL